MAGNRIGPMRVLVWASVMMVSTVAWARDMIVETEVSASRAYVNEMIRVTYDVYVPVERGRVIYEVREPVFEGWYAVDAKVPETSEPVVREGGSYLKERFGQYVVAAIAPGRVSVPEMSVSVPWEAGRWVKSAPVSVEILPVPGPVPDGFWLGHVGRFQLTLEDAGRGLIKLRIDSTSPGPGVRPSLISVPDGVRVGRWEREQVTERVTAQGYNSEVIYRARLEADRAGTYAIGPATLIAFDPAQHRYVTATSSVIRVRLEAGAQAIDFSEEDERMVEEPEAAEFRGWGWILGVLVLGLAAVLGVWGRRRMGWEDANAR